MIVKGSELIGLEVINKSKHNLGYTVKDVIFAHKGYYVTALLLRSNYAKKESLKKCKALSFNKIINIEDSIVTLNEKSIITLEQRPDLLELVEKPIQIIGFEIYTHDNNLVGIVKDTIINVNNGRIMGLIISEGLFTDLYNGYTILPMDSNFCKNSNSKIVINDICHENMFSYGAGLKNLFSIDSDN